MRLAFSEKLAPERVRREIVITFNNDGVVALRQGNVVPRCFHEHELNIFADV